VKAGIGDLWNGRVPLARAFWEYAIIYGTTANLVVTLASLVAFTQGWHALGITIFVLPIPYNMLMIVAVWRSAARYRGPPIWNTLARALIIVWAVIASLA
jgi:hypothetical protein